MGLPVFVAGNGLVEFGDQVEVLHDDADIHRAFKFRGQEVLLPTVVCFNGRKPAPEFAFLVAVVRHHRQRLNEVWAFGCDMVLGKVRLFLGQKRAPLNSLKQLTGLFHGAGSCFLLLFFISDHWTT